MGVAAQAVSLRASIRQLISSTPELMKEEGYRNALAKLRRTAEGFDARNLEDARAQFGFFSADLIAFLKVYPALVDHPIYTITCRICGKILLLSGCKRLRRSRTHFLGNRCQTADKLAARCRL